VVYPLVNGEDFHWAEFDSLSPNTSLLDMDYPDEVFFQYLADQVGDTGVLQLIANMPATGDRSAQLTALAAYPNIDSLFHNFARAYLDMKISDTGGGLISIVPAVDHVTTFSTSQTKTLTTQSFVLTRAEFIYPQGKRHTLTEAVPSGLTSAAEDSSELETWAALPATIAAACGDIAYIYTVTGTSAADAEQDVNITSATEDFDGQCDRCVVGRWQMDNMSHWNAFLTALPTTSTLGTPALESIDGTVTVEFTSDGRMTLTLDNFHIHYTQDGQGAHVDATIAGNGPMQSSW
jgi:hypothetical protein